MTISRGLPILAPAFLVSAVASEAPVKGTSTAEERAQWVEITHKLAPKCEYRQGGESALKQVSDAHDIHVPLCPTIRSEFNGMKDAYAQTITWQYLARRAWTSSGTTVTARITTSPISATPAPAPCAMKNGTKPAATRATLRNPFRARCPCSSPPPSRFLPKESANMPSGSNGTMGTIWVFTHGSSFAKSARAGSARPQKRRDNSCLAPAPGSSIPCKI